MRRAGLAHMMIEIHAHPHQAFDDALARVGQRAPPDALPVLQERPQPVADALVGAVDDLLRWVGLR